MSSFLTIPALFVFPMLVAYAAASDLLTMRITNRLVLLAVVAFFPVALVAGLSLETIGWHVLGGVVVLAVTFGLFAMGWIGGGDAKLIAAIAMWFGPMGMVPYLLYASVLGGTLTLVLLSARRLPLPLQLKQVVWIDRL